MTTADVNPIGSPLFVVGHEGFSGSKVAYELIELVFIATLSAEGFKMSQGILYPSLPKAWNQAAHKRGFGFAPLADHAGKIIALFAQMVPVQDKLPYGKFLQPVRKEVENPFGPVSQKEYPFLVCSAQDEEQIELREHSLTPSTDVAKSIGSGNSCRTDAQGAIVEEFAPRFAPGAYLLYLGDTAHKTLHIETEMLEKLNIPVTKHDKLPDVVLYDAKKNWLFLIEAVTSHGPLSPKRQFELELILKDCPAELVFVSAFPDGKEFRKHVVNIAWESEVWLADSPDHLIHFNGDKFLGPHPQKG
jgi:hypothetical protein